MSINDSPNSFFNKGLFHLSGEKDPYSQHRFDRAQKVHVV